MKINEVETLVGITRKNIRYYESEDLLHPRRNTENGYRDYGEADVVRLRQIRLLRKLGVPVAEIRSMYAGAMTVGDAIQRRQVLLRRELRNLQQTDALCALLADSTERLDALDAEVWLNKIAQLEQEGTSFMDHSKQDRKRHYAGAALGAGIFLALLAGVAALLIWAMRTAPEDAPPWWLVGIIFGILAVVAVCVAAMLVQRIHEIQRGEESDAVRKY